MKGKILSAFKTNDQKICLYKNSSVQEIYIFWLYYSDIKIRDIFVYEHILMMDTSWALWSQT